jgi:hypothetical protein
MNLKMLDTDTFKLLYPEDWVYELLDDYLYTIYPIDGLGAFQISSYSTINPEIEYDIEQEKLSFQNSEIKDYGNFKAIMDIDNITLDDFVVIKWIIGRGRTKLFCTYTTAKSDFQSENNKTSFQNIEDIVQSIIIK